MERQKAAELVGVKGKVINLSLTDSHSLLALVILKLLVFPYSVVVPSHIDVHSSVHSTNSP